ncbi:RING/FYVE/PHD-type zinc finger family protein isoform 3 [Hibiscus syriacus]|uniref:RING/FYVE/PHD-type zinc finger family protein isoform 3 n=1 Tax=Hibiscus syriacus TaxID=106335 RepID=A0A6A2YL76_HIBSY|nr:RING/FYVE/PHD-type zinc finger family protein isoform 3 [Hibiscus syriacus]
MEEKIEYPKILHEDYQSKLFSDPDLVKVEEYREESNPINKNVVQDGKQLKRSKGAVDPIVSRRNDMAIVSGLGNQKQGKVFYYDTPVSEETGVWAPVSVPPMTENKHEEWDRGLFLNGGHFPDDGLGSNQFTGDSKDLTMWDVFSEMLIAARGKVSAIASGDDQRRGIAWLSNHLLEQTWNEMAQTLAEANFGNFNEILEAELPKWLADSAASACMLCNVRFHPIMRSRHHCRFCGGIFCNECSKGRSLLPMKFCMGNPQRVCDVCCVRLEPVQPYLMDRVSRAAQLPTHDLTDLSTLRSWLNLPWVQSMEHEIYKAANTINNYTKVGSLKPEKSIPDAILRQAKGLAILTVAKVGVIVTYNIGTGLIVARRDDGSWSPPSAITSFGVGWGVQAGGEFTDFIIVLRNESAVATFSGNMHLSVGAGLSAAVGIIGRAAEADIRGGSGGYAACYTYSCSKAGRSYFPFYLLYPVENRCPLGFSFDTGRNPSYFREIDGVENGSCGPVELDLASECLLGSAFVGCSLEGSVVTTRNQENRRFYGNPSITASDILLGSLPMPPAASTLHQALLNLFEKLER